MRPATASDRRPAVALEPLEPRVLLSVGDPAEDLVGSAFSPADADGASGGQELSASAPQAGEEVTSTHSFTNDARGSHPGTVTRSGNQIIVDLSGLPADAEIYRAIFVHNRAGNSGTSSWASLPLRIESADEPGNWLATLPPRHLYIDCTEAARRALASPARRLVLNLVSFPGFDFASGVRIDVTCDQPLPVGHSLQPVQDITVVHRDGDTMVTFTEPTALLTNPNATVGEYEAVEPAFDSPNAIRYRIYRYTQPIDNVTIRLAELVDEIKPLSNWNPYYYGIYWRDNDAQVVPRLPVDDGVLSDVDQGIYIRRAPAAAGGAYYAVSYVVNGEENLTDWTAGENVSAAPVAEAPGPGMVLLRQHVHYGVTQSWQYVGSGMEGPDLYYYVRWDAPPAYNLPSSAFDYLVAVPPEPYRVDPAPVDVALHCWGANLNSGYGWWYEAENGALLVSTNMKPYDWWTAYHDNYGTIRPFTDVDGNAGGTVHDYPADRILSFLDDFVSQGWNVDLDRILLTGSSMGGAGAIMWGARAADRFAYANGWVGVYIPRETPQFKSSFEGVYGTDAWNCLYEDSGLSAFDYWDSARFVQADPGQEVPYLCFANGKNDGAIGWTQAWRFVSALIEAHQPFKFTWGQAGHGQRSILPGGNDRNIGVTIARDATLPAFTHCSQDQDMGDGNPAVGDPEGYINRYLLWEPQTATDLKNLWQMTILLVGASPDAQASVDVTPRRCQAFRPAPGTPVQWTNTQVTTGIVVQSGSAVVDQWGLITLPQMTVSKAKNRIAIAVPLPGDADWNGQVDGADYTVWADHYRQPGDWSLGDFNGDGFVDGADYTLWADNFTDSGGGSATPAGQTDGAGSRGLPEALLAKTAARLATAAPFPPATVSDGRPNSSAALADPPEAGLAGWQEPAELVPQDRQTFALGPDLARAARLAVDVGEKPLGGSTDLPDGLDLLAAVDLSAMARRF